MVRCVLPSESYTFRPGPNFVSFVRLAACPNPLYRKSRDVVHIGRPVYSVDGVQTGSGMTDPENVSARDVELSSGMATGTVADETFT